MLEREKWTKRERRMGCRGYVTLMAWREDGFVFSGEQLALVFHFQREESTAAEKNKENFQHQLFDHLFFVFLPPFFSSEVWPHTHKDHKMKTSVHISNIIHYTLLSWNYSEVYNIKLYAKTVTNS